MEGVAENPESTLALRVLYGSLTYIDDLAVPSPAGTYSRSLTKMDEALCVQGSAPGMCMKLWSA